MYKATATGLGPEIVDFLDGRDLTPRSWKYILRPEAAETWFYLWRFTKVWTPRAAFASPSNPPYRARPGNAPRRGPGGSSNAFSVGPLGAQWRTVRRLVSTERDFSDVVSLRTAECRLSVS